MKTRLAERMRRLDWLALPLLAFTLSQAALGLTAVLCARNPLNPASFSRRDSTKYLKIARLGYFEDPRDPQAGTAGWFPGYALAMRAGAWLTGARPITMGRALSAVFQLALLAVLALVFLPADTTRRALGLLIAGFFPGYPYYGAVFPMSMSAFLSLAAIALCGQGRYLAAGLVGAVGAFSYASGFLVAAALAAGIFMKLGPTRAAVVAAVKALVPCGLGLGAVLVQQHFALGRWDAFFAYQRAFGQAVSNPAATLLANVSRLWSDPYRPARLVGLQALVVAGLMVTAAVIWWRRRRDADPLETMLIVNALAFWAFPLLLGANTSTYRQAALLVGITPLLARLSLVALLCILVMLVVLGVGMAVLFFDDVLI